MEKGIYIFDNETDFINALEQLKKNYEPLSIKKHIATISDLNNEISFLKRCRINSFLGFQTKKQIKLDVTASNGVIYDVTYSFNYSLGARCLYILLNRWLNKNTDI